MPQIIGEASRTLFELHSAQSEMHDRLERVSTTPTSTPTSSSRGSSQPAPKRPPKRRARDTWSYSRAAKDGEDYKNKHGHRYWYCKISDCPYNGTTTLRNAREHLERSHGIVSADEPSDRNKLRKTTVENMFAMQKSRQKEEQWIKQLNVLKSTLNHNVIQQALVGSSYVMIFLKPSPNGLSSLPSALPSTRLLKRPFIALTHRSVVASPSPMRVVRMTYVSSYFPLAPRSTFALTRGHHRKAIIRNFKP